MTISPSSTSTGKGEAGPRASAAPRGAASAGVRQRKTVTTTKSPASRGVSNNPGMWRFYTEDSPGLKVYVFSTLLPHIFTPIKFRFNCFLSFFVIFYSGPVPVLVMSLIFIASVFVLHIWGKYTRS